MPRTLADYLDIAEHTAGGQIDASIDLTHTVNDAGRYLIQMHDWAFLERPQAQLNTVLSQAYIDLPSDFNQLIAIGSNADYDTEAIRLLPADQFEKVKSSEITDLLDVYVSLEWPTQASTAGNAARPRLAVYPVPASSTTAKYWLNYKAGWIELSDVNAVANLPQDMEHLMVQLVRAFTRGEVNGEGSQRELDAIESSIMLARLKENYGLVNATPAPMEGGAIQCLKGRHDGRQHSTITSKA